MSAEKCNRVNGVRSLELYLLVKLLSEKGFLLRTAEIYLKHSLPSRDSNASTVKVWLAFLLEQNSVWLACQDLKPAAGKQNLACFSIWPDLRLYFGYVKPWLLFCFVLAVFESVCSVF